METNNSRNQNPNTIKNLEELIFHEVFPKLPAESLLRFKFVARHWDAFIKSVEFLKTHVRHLPSHLNSNSSRSSVLILDSRRFFQFLDYGEANFDDSSCKCLSFLISPCVDEEGIDRKIFCRRHVIGSYDILLSSCNGIAFMVSPSEDADLSCRFGFHYVLYNPLLGPHPLVKIPHPDDNRLGSEDPWPFDSYGFGFGYVSSTEDYYIVAINLPRGLKIVVSLYSLRSKTWRNDAIALSLSPEKVGSILPLVFKNKYWYRNTGTLVKETLHWGIQQGLGHHIIFAYNLATLRYSRILYPAKFIATQDNVREMGLCCLDDCLCAWAQNRRNTVELWRRKGSNWSGLFRIKTVHRVCDFFGFNKTDHFLIFSDVNQANNKAGVDYKLYLSNFMGNKRLIGRHIRQKIWNAVNYVPSLESFQAMNSETNQ